MHRSAPRAAAILAAAMLLPGAALAEAYTWVDERGTVHFSEEPPPKRVRARKLDLPDEAPRSEGSPAGEKAARKEPGRAPPAASQAPLAPLAAKARPAPAVELYTTGWCPWCKKARAWFAGQGIAFTERDIDRDARALEEKLRLDGTRNVPTAVIGGKVVRGYAPERYQAALDGR